MKYTVMFESREEGGFTIQCIEVQREELHRKSPARHCEISQVEVADVA
jgi:hypothetical protein